MWRTVTQHRMFSHNGFILVGRLIAGLVSAHMKCILAQ